MIMALGSADSYCCMSFAQLEVAVVKVHWKQKWVVEHSLDTARRAFTRAQRIGFLPRHELGGETRHAPPSGA